MLPTTSENAPSPLARKPEIVEMTSRFSTSTIAGKTESATLANAQARNTFLLIFHARRRAKTADFFALVSVIVRNTPF